MSTGLDVRVRRAIGFACVIGVFSLDVLATGLLGGSERGLAIVRSIVLPGLPFLEWHLALGLLGMVCAVASVFAWLRWGVDWLLPLVMVTCVGVAAFVMPLHHSATASRELHAWIEASHEFTIVLIVFAFVARLRVLLDRMPGGAWLHRRLPDAFSFSAVDVARTSALRSLAGDEPASIAEPLRRPELLGRAVRVNRWARFRFRGDPLCGAHAPLRAALSLAGMLDESQEAAFRAEAGARLAGVSDSEPTWVRPLDGMLASIALDALGESACVSRWRVVFGERFGLRHGRRAAALHTPSMLSIGTAPAWEHAAATALAFRMGWTEVQDWPLLRPRCLGTAAGGRQDPDSLRLVAAGRLWARLTGDAEALEILDRRTLDGDDLAATLDRLSVPVSNASRGVSGA